MCNDTVAALSVYYSDHALMLLDLVIATPTLSGMHSITNNTAVYEFGSAALPVRTFSPEARKNPVKPDEFTKDTSSFFHR